MTYNSKRTIVSIISGVILMIAYLAYAFGNNAPEADDLKGWAIAILVLVGIGVVSQIVIQIIFHILYSIAIAVKERDIGDEQIERILSSTVTEDEMDKLINLKSAHIGYICVGVGFIVALVALAFSQPVVYALHILLGSFLLGSFAEGCVTVYLYERGIRNG
jgi:uncharacterized membrane protein